MLVEGGPSMTFDEVLAQVRELLEREGRVSYRALKRRFAFDDEYLEDLKAELIDAKRLAEFGLLLSEVYNWFTEGFDTKDRQETKALLEELSHCVIEPSDYCVIESIQEYHVLITHRSAEQGFDATTEPNTCMPPFPLSCYDSPMR